MEENSLMRVLEANQRREKHRFVQHNRSENAFIVNVGLFQIARMNIFVGIEYVGGHELNLAREVH
jgi:hypothetical protein